MSISPIDKYDIYTLDKTRIHILGETHYDNDEIMKDKNKDIPVSTFLLNQIKKSKYSILLLEMFPIEGKEKENFLKNYAIKIKSKNMNEIIKYIIKDENKRLQEQVFGADYRRIFTFKYNQDGKNIQEIIYNHPEIIIKQDILNNFFKDLFIYLHNWYQGGFKFQGQEIKKISPELVNVLEKIAMWLKYHKNNQGVYKKNYTDFLIKLQRNLSVIGDFELFINLIKFIESKVLNIYILIGSKHSENFRNILKRYLVSSKDSKNNKIEL